MLGSHPQPQSHIEHTLPKVSNKSGSLEHQAGMNITIAGQACAVEQGAIFTISSLLFSGT